MIKYYTLEKIQSRNIAEEIVEWENEIDPITQTDTDNETVKETKKTDTTRKTVTGKIIKNNVEPKNKKPVLKQQANENLDTRKHRLTRKRNIIKLLGFFIILWLGYLGYKLFKSLR